MSATQRDAIRHFCQQKGMTEEELAKKINEDFEKPTGEELIHVLNKGAAIGRREMLDKACEWLNENIEDITYFDDGYKLHDVVINDYAFKKEFMESFKKAMEE